MLRRHLPAWNLFQVDYFFLKKILDRTGFVGKHSPFSLFDVRVKLKFRFSYSQIRSRHTRRA